MARYTVGESVIIAAFSYALANGDRRDSHNWFVPHMLGVPFTFTLQKLQVIEEKDVAWAYDPKGEKNSKGYICHDDHGGVWYNQYPYLNGEQTSDASNYVFHENSDGPNVHGMPQCGTDILNLLNGLRCPTDTEPVPALEDLRECLIAQLKVQFDIDVELVPIWKNHPKFVHYVYKTT